MSDPNLVIICITAFTAVFILLALLAGVMQLIMMIFPKAGKVIEPTYIAAISSTFQALIPGSKVTRIEEIK